VNLAWRHHREHAMLAGTELAIGDFVFEFESTRADFSWDIIDKLYEKSVSGFDIVYAYPKGNTKKKSKIFYWLLNKLTYLNIETATEKAKIISRKALNRVLLEKAKVRYRKVLYKHCGFPASFIEYEPIQKDFSENEITFFQKASLATDVFIVFSNIGTHIAMFFSFVSFILSASIGIYALTVYLTGQATISGWTTTMLFLSLGFSGIFLILTIMSKYISIMLSEQRKGQLYTIQNIDKISIH
jgi:dolichol-phosphate mannosyltransferase